MKQHINVEQMKEVKDKELAKYMDLHFTHLLEAVCYYGAEKPIGRSKLNEMAEMITIGKMIEIIEEKTEHMFIIDACLLKGNNYENLGKGYGVSLRGKYKNKNFNYTHLCDALWEATKFVLGENKQ
jgi:hypothetical protein